MATTLDRPSPPVPAPVGIDPVCDAVIAMLQGYVPLPAQHAVAPGAIAAWCRRNKLPLLALPAGARASLATDAAFAAALDDERAWYATQRDEYVAARAAWLAAGIDCLTIKSAGNHPAFPHTSDNIDILVRPDAGRAARDVLRRLGYVEVRNVEEPGKFLFRRFHAGRCVSAIHVHEEIAWFVGFLDDVRVWQRSRPAVDDPLVTIPSPEDAILINLAHACYENKELRLNDVLRVRHALAEAGDALDWEYLHAIAATRGWDDGLAWLLLVHARVERALWGASLIPEAELARCERAVAADAASVRRLAAIAAAGIRDLPLDLGYAFCKRLYYRKIAADSRRDRRERLRDTAVTLVWGVRLKSRIRPQRGFVVSLSGIDGSGKSAHAEALAAAFRLCEVRAGHVWSRAGSGGLTGLVSRAARRGAGVPGEDARDAVSRRRARLASPLAATGWAWLVAFDQLQRDLRLVRLPAARGRVVVADRCAYDTAVELDASLPPSARLARVAIPLLLRLSRRPDLPVLLDLPVASARARKPDEFWHADLEAERARYLALAEREGLRVLASDGPFTESSDRLIHEAIMAFMARYETRLNALFYANSRQKNAPDPIWAGEGAR